MAGPAALSVALAPVHRILTGLVSLAVPHPPGSDLDHVDVAPYGTATVAIVLAANLVVDAVVNPSVEALCRKGHLLPRLPVGGLAKPLLAGSLFALQPFRELGDVAPVAVVQSALCWLAFATQEPHGAARGPLGGQRSGRHRLLQHPPRLKPGRRAARR